MTSTFRTTQPAAIYAYELNARSKEFLSAVVRLSPDTSGVQYPVYFLLAHCLELKLKAWLVLYGVKKSELWDRNKFGHDLSKCFKAAQDLKLPCIQHLDHLCNRLQEMNGDHDFRYPTGYNLQLPALSLCLPVIDKLESEIGIRLFLAQQEAWANLKSNHPKGTQFIWTD